MIFFGAIVVLLSISPEAQRPGIAVFSFEDTSCGAWSNSATNEALRAQYHYWFRGFVSGYNVGNPTHQVALGRMPAFDTLALYVDKYCGEHPLNPFISAGFGLVEELRDK